MEKPTVWFALTLLMINRKEKNFNLRISLFKQFKYNLLEE